MATARPLLALDTETTGLDPWRGDRPFMVTACEEDGTTHAWEWTVNPVTREVKSTSKDRAQIRKLIRDHTIVLHNAKFDVRMLVMAGVLRSPNEVWKNGQFEETLLASHLWNSLPPHGLKYLAKTLLKYPDDDEKELQQAVVAARRVGKRRGWTLGTDPNGKAAVKSDYWMPRAVDPDNDVCLAYGESDVERTMLLWQVLSEYLQSNDLYELYEEEKKVLQVTYDVEDCGLALRPRVLMHEIKRYEFRKNNLEAEIREQVEHDHSYQIENLDSPTEFVKVFHDLYEHPVELETEKGNPKRDKESLAYYATTAQGGAKKFLELMLLRAKVSTSLSYLTSYMHRKIPNGRGYLLHPSYNTVGTSTTRFSSSNPNAQNIGKGDPDEDDYKLRKVFGPRAGHVWFCIDYNQLELRLLAQLAGEEKMLEVFEDDGDIHQLTADLCDIPRSAAKAVNYALIYGAGQGKLEAMTGVEDFGKVFRASFPAVDQFMKLCIETGKKHREVTTSDGYPLRVFRGEEYVGCNYVIQGTAGRILKKAMLLCAKELAKAKQGRMIATIHDELVFEFPKTEYTTDLVLRLRQLMEQAGKMMGLHTPADIKRVVRDWSKPVELPW